MARPAQDRLPHKVTASPQTRTELHGIVASGQLHDLRWPDFSDYRTPLEALYKSWDYDTLWIRNGFPTPQARQMISILQQAESEGLMTEDYDSSRWPGRLAYLQVHRTPLDEARFDIALTVCTMRYVSDLSAGRPNPLHTEYGLVPGRKKIDLPTFIRESLLEGRNLQAALASLEPPLAEYHELQQALVRYIRLAEEDDGQKLPDHHHIVFSGMTYDGVPRLVRLLRLVGDLPESAVVPADSQLYDGALVEAVQRFQKRHNLSPTGNLDMATLQELNVPLSFRRDQIRIALEHYRWLNYDFRQPPVIINIPESRLYALNESGGVALTMTVDVGQEYTRTPVLEDKIEYLVFRPYWIVPVNIQRDEIVPNIKYDRNYLSKGHFEVVTSVGKLVTNGRASAEVLQQLSASTLHVRQKPGSDNSMGLVKFVFPNRYSVYLHGTPSWGNYFDKSDRNVSHGCIHLKEPDKLAAWALRDKPEWTLERVQYAMREGQDNLKVNLAKPIPVLIVYVTAVVDESGEVYFYPDIYGYDAELRRTLTKGYAPR
jgi:murein L,D-transpeptidase YcbB/YkuD